MSSGEKTGPSEPSSVPSGGQSSPQRNDFDGPPEEGGARKPGRRRRAAAQCQVCHTGLHAERPYYQRYRICPRCSTKDRLGADGGLQRFCQQCGKFQDVALFDGMMRTCRERLNRHAARRRKAHARSLAAEYGADAYLPPGGAGCDGGGVPPSRAAGAGVLEMAQAVLQRVEAHRDVESARRMPSSHDLHLPYAQEVALIALPLRPAARDLLTPLLEPLPVRFHPPLFAGGGHSHLVDPVAAQARLEAVLASATAAIAARSAGGGSDKTAIAKVDAKQSSEPGTSTNAGDALKNALEWLIQGANSGGGGGGVPAPPPASDAAEGPSALHSALGTMLAGIMRRQGGGAAAEEPPRPPEGGGV